MKTISRRMFLTGAGGAMLALPWLESHASAQGMTAPKRLIVVKSFSTQLIQEWHPRFAGNGYRLHDAVYSGSKADGTTLLTQPLGTMGGYTQAPLADLQTPAGISGVLGPSLNPYLSKLLLVRGLDFLPMVNHNYGGLLGNYSSCTGATPCTADGLPDVPTIDQVLAYSPKFYPTTPAVRSLHLSQGVTNAMSYSDLGNAGGPVQQLQTRTNPVNAFNDCFQGFMPGGGPPAPNRDRLIIDRVREDWVRLKASPRLSRDDKTKVDQYVTLVTELQARLAPTQMLSCTPPVAPASLANNSGTDPTDIVTKWNLMLDIAAAAIMCDRTRIITLAVHKALGPSPNAADPQLQGYYHSEDASGGTWHGLAHDWGNANSRRMLKGVNAWVAEHVFAKLLQKLDVMEGGGRTYLDNSLVYWGNELGFNHIAYSVPCLLAGSAGGTLRTGRYLDYVNWNNNAFFSQEMGNVILGIPHNRLLVTILQAMGLSPTDYERGGQPGYGSTSTNGKAPNLWPVNYDLSAVGQVLPGINA